MLGRQTPRSVAMTTRIRDRVGQRCSAARTTAPAAAASGPATALATFLAHTSVRIACLAASLTTFIVGRLLLALPITTASSEGARAPACLARCPSSRLPGRIAGVVLLDSRSQDEHVVRLGRDVVDVQVFGN